MFQIAQGMERGSLWRQVRNQFGGASAGSWLAWCYALPRIRDYASFIQLYVLSGSLASIPPEFFLQEVEFTFLLLTELCPVEQSRGLPGSSTQVYRAPAP